MAMQETQTLERVDLFAATQSAGVVADSMTIAKSQVLKQGAILKSDGTQVDAGSDTVYAILAEDVDTTAAAKSAPVYLFGEFNAKALHVGGSITVADMKAAARNVGIFIK